jgi:hypothetical protein
VKDYREQIEAMIKLMAFVLPPKEGEVVRKFQTDVSEAMQSLAEVDKEFAQKLRRLLNP